MMSLKSIRSKLLAVFLTIIFFLLLSAGYFLTLILQSNQELEKIKSFKESSAVTGAVEGGEPALVSGRASNNEKTAPTGDLILTTSDYIKERNDNLYWGIVSFTFITIIILISGALWIIRAFRNSLQKPALVLESLVKGNTS